MPPQAYYSQNFFLKMHYWENYSIQDFFLLDSGEYFISDLTRLPDEYPKVRTTTKEGTLKPEKVSQIKQYLKQSVTQSSSKEMLFRGCEIIYKPNNEETITRVNDIGTYSDLKMLIPDYHQFFKKIYLELT